MLGLGSAMFAGSLLAFINKDKNYAAVFGKQIPLPGSSFQNLIDLDIIFKDQEIIYKKDPYLNNANSIYNSDFKRSFNSLSPIIGFNYKYKSTINIYSS